MNRPLKILAVAAGAIALLASVGAIRTLSTAGQFTTIKPLGGETCREMAGIVGAEDIAIDRAAGIAYVSSTDRAAARRGEDVRGEIFALGLGGTDAVPTPATSDAPDDFRPAGVSLWSPADGERRLFVVNRRRAGPPTVEVFAVDSGRLAHLRTIRDPGIASPNDLHAVGADRFYVTNDGGEGARRIVDFALQRLTSYVAYFDGEAARVAAGDFGFANGINASADGATIYVSDTFTRRLRFFGVDAGSGALMETGSLMLGTGLDNIDVDATGSLWIAAHPKLLDLMLYVGGWRERAPSQVIRAVPAAGGGGEARTILLDLGKRLSAASVAANVGDRYLVGSLIDSKMLICPAASGG